MCDPTTIAIAALAISAAGTVAAQDAQRSQTNRQQDAMAAQAQDDANSRGLQMNQVSEAAAQQANERNKAAREEAASFDVVSGEYGGGITAERQAANVAFNQSSDLSTITANKNRQLSQLGHESLAGSLNYQNNLASLSRPSSLGTGLKIGGAALNTYGTYEQNQAAATARAQRANPTGS